MSDGRGKRKRRKPSFLSTRDMKSLIEIFYYFERKGIVNRTLDQVIYECFCHLCFKNDKNVNLRNELQNRLLCIIYPTKTYLSCSHWCQIRELKGQLNCYRYLSRDLPLNERKKELIDGIDNEFSKQRYFVDANLKKNE